MRLRSLSLASLVVIATVAALTGCGRTRPGGASSGPVPVAGEGTGGAVAEARPAKVALEEIPVDVSTRRLECEVYGFPGVYFSKDYHPLVEIENDGSFPIKATGIFYLRNTGGQGEAEITAEKGDQKLAKQLAFRAGQDYLIKVDVGVGQSVSWQAGMQSTPHSVAMSVGDIRKSVSFELPFCRETSLLSIRAQEMPGGIVAVSDGPPDAGWFADSLWQEKYRYCDNVEHYFRLRSDGTIEDSYVSADKLKLSKKHTWKVEGGSLRISWNAGFATQDFPLEGKRAERYLGTHSNSGVPRVIEKLK